MTTPTRRSVKLRPTLGHIRQLVSHHADAIELGWSHLIEDLHAAGWPDRTPDDDRRARRPSEHDDPIEPDVLDYADPTGEMALRLDRLHADREALEDHRMCAETSLRAMELIARRYRPPAIESAPACTIAGCDNPVESRQLTGGTMSYVGMKLVHGFWVAKPGPEPVCTRHRKQRERQAS